MTRIPRNMRQRISSADKAKRAAELYAEGRTWKEIADELGVRSQAGVRQLVDRYVQKLPMVATSTVREMLLERLTRAHETALEGLKHRDVRVRLKAADVVARVAERIAKLHGLERLEVQHALIPPAPPPDRLVTRLSTPELPLVREVARRLQGEGSFDDVVRAARRLVAFVDATTLAATPAIALLPAKTSPGHDEKGAPLWDDELPPEGAQA